MATFENEALGVTFELPDTMTVFQQLAFRGEIAKQEGGPFIRFWEGAKAIMVKWECDDYPELKKIDLNATDDRKLAEIVTWVSNQTAGHIEKLGEIPKNV